MKFIVDNNTVIIDYRSYPGLCTPQDSVSGAFKPETPAELIARLQADPNLASALLSTGEKRLLYMGPDKDMRVAGDGPRMGVHYDRSERSNVLEGDNYYGATLMRIRDDLRKSLAESGIVEELPVDESLIIEDYLRRGASLSDIERRETETDERFIHVDPYRAARLKNDTRRDGSTGFVRRPDDDGIPFHTFVSPFGLTANSKVRVHNAAELSYCYEAALRGDLDYKALLDTLRSDGLMSISDAKRDSLVAELRSQFDWMREKVSTDLDLRGRQIVTTTRRVPDGSFGTSFYDARYSPSPAHILARYIANPSLLYVPSQNSVVRALSSQEKGEPVRFAPVDSPEVTIIVFGSDTLAGRLPDTKTVFEKVTEVSLDDNGVSVQEQKRRALMVFKSREQSDAEAQAFADRLDDIIANIPENTRIRFVSGTGVGPARVLENYVLARGGRAYEWTPVGKNESEDAVPSVKVRELPAFFQQIGVDIPEGGRLSVMMVPQFSDCLPVISGRLSETAFVYTDLDNKKGYYRMSRADGLNADAAVCFMENEDKNHLYFINRNASMIASAGLPVINVIDHMSAEEQEKKLLSEAVTVDQILGSAPEVQGSLFEGVEPRWKWNLPEDASQTFHSIRRQGDGAAYVPGVFVDAGAGMNVEGQELRSIYGVYLALVAKESLGVGDTLTGYLARIAGAEGDVAALAAIRREFDESVSADSLADEKAMRSAVGLAIRTSSALADFLAESGDADIVLPCSNWPDTVHFTTPEGNGQNRFGIVLMDARRQVLETRRELREMAYEDREREMAENERLRRELAERIPVGEKIEGGLPQVMPQQPDGVWFLGTHRPEGLMVPEGKESYVAWNTEFGKEMLKRGIVESVRFKDGDGVTENRFVVMAASDDEVLRGKRGIDTRADSYEVVRAVRRDESGKPFVCGFGVPVKHDNRYNERINRFGMPCSFKSDQEFGDFVRQLCMTDSRARLAAMSRGLALMTPVRIDRDGNIIPYMARVFEKNTYGLLPTIEFLENKIQVMSREELAGVIGKYGLDDIPMEYTVTQETGGQKVEVTEQQPLDILREAVREGLIMKFGEEGALSALDSKILAKNGNAKGWFPNPHAAPNLESAVHMHQHILEQGEFFPLNCIALPSDDYGNVESMSDEQKDEMFRKFKKEVNFTLNMMASFSNVAGLPMKFPLGPDGRIDIGPNVPKEFSEWFENRVNSFIGANKAVDIQDKPLPIVEQVTTDALVLSRDKKTSTGTDLWIRPSDLACAFGEFNFDSIRSGKNGPVYDMALRFDDGTVIRLVDTKLSKNEGPKAIASHIDYTFGSQRHFTVHSNNIERIPECLDVIKAYVERAKYVRYESGLLAEDEIDTNIPLSSKGYLDITSSNSADYSDLECTFATRSVNASSIPIDAVTDPAAIARFNGEDVKDEYPGMVDARDGFKGWAVICYVLPDGQKSDWKVIDDKALGYHVFMDKSIRIYRDELYEVPTNSYMDVMLRSYAVKAGMDALSQPSCKVGLPAEEKTEVKTEVKAEAVAPQVETPRAEPEVKAETQEVAPAVNLEIEFPGDEAESPFKVDVVNHNGVWTRAEAAANPNKLYVFTDNTDRDSGRNVIDRNSEYYRRYGDGVHDLHYPTMSTAVLRGLDNALPVSTQRWYHDGAKGTTGRWTDADAKEFAAVVKDEFSVIKDAVASGRFTEVVFPQGDGLFNGKFSEFSKERVPKLYAILRKELDSFGRFVREYNGEKVESRPRVSASRKPSSTTPSLH